MGEFIKGSLTINDLQRIQQEDGNEWFRNLPLFSSDFQVDPVRTADINFSQKIGCGYQGSICLVADDKVAKLLKLKKQNEVSANEITIVASSIYASNIRVGPTIHGSPFITTDGKYVVIIMDKVSMYRPNEDDVNEIISLFEQMIENQFMTFDMEFGKTPSGQIVVVDFGVSGFYRSKYEALQSAINNDLFADTGLGYYNRTLEEHFTRRMAEMGPSGGKSRSGDKKKKKKTIRKRGKKRKTYRKRHHQ